MKHLIAIALVVAACHKDQSATGSSAKEAMGLYAKGFNLLLKDPREMIDTYFRSIPKGGPSLDAKPSLFPSQQMAASSIKEARAAFEAAKKEAPGAMAELGPASDRVIAATDKLTATYTDAQKYYEAQSYKDDKLAKGKQLHTEMIAAAKEFDTAIEKMESGLSSIEDAQAADAVKAHEGDKDYGYWYRFYNLQAKRFLVAVERDPKKADDANKTLESIHADFTKFVAAKGHDVNGAFTAYITAADSFHAAATVLVRAVHENGDVGAADQSLVSTYNSLINMGNALGDVEAAGGLK